MTAELNYVVFAGTRRVAAGQLRDVLPVLKRRFDRNRSDVGLVFEVETGRQVEFDLRGTPAEILEREVPAPQRGRGRPKLGVVSREISLLPRHWGWLEEQSAGISGALRRLVEQAMKAQPGKQRVRRAREALSRFLYGMAGDRPNYEEAGRALFAGDLARFEWLVRRWPKDIRDHAVAQARLAMESADAGTGDAAAVVRDVYERIWTGGDVRAIERLVAPRYTIHSDPGDAWAGRTLDRKTYEERVRYSRDAFPDLAFTVHDVIVAGSRVAARWSAAGTHTGDLRDLPATGKRLEFAGQTIYEVTDGRIAGHWQVVDRLGFLQQLRPATGTAH
jgi:steroid delta-isomerase-like uncharacterized protein